MAVALKINFTKNVIRDLECPPGKSEIYVYDTDTKGLAVRVTKAGGKTFYAIRKVNAKDQRRKLEVFDFKKSNIPSIRDAASKVYANLDVILVEEARKDLRGSVTVDDAFESMISRRKKLALSTIGDYRKTYENYVKPFCGDRALGSITNDDVLDLHEKVTEPVKRQNGEMSPKRCRSANKAVSLLGTIFSYSIKFYMDAMAEPVFRHNPVKIMVALGNWHENARDSIRINPGDLGAVISNTIDVGNTQPLRDVPTSFKTASAAVLFMLFSGIRPGEIGKVRKSYVCHKTRSIVFPRRSVNEADAVKNSKEFHLVLNDTAYCQLLYAMQQSTGEYVFAGVDLDRLSESNVRDFLSKVGRNMAGGRQHLPRKIFRASFISIAERAGVGEFYIKVLCNHSGKGQTVDVTDGYKTAYLSEIRMAAMKVEAEIYLHSQVDKDKVCRGLFSGLKPLDVKALEAKSVSLGLRRNSRE